MDSRTAKVLSAILIGGLLGMVTMLSLASNLWPLGLGVGFLGGYLSYDLRTVMLAVPKAWQSARGWNYKAVPGIAKQTFLAFVVLVFAMISLCATPIFILISIKTKSDSAGNQGLAIVLCIMFIFLFFKTYSNLFNKKAENNDVLEWRDLWDFNPVKVYLWDIPRVLIFEVIPFGTRFTWYFIRLIHSELRLLCGLDAALCSLMFHYTGNNVFLGLFVGLACGLLQFEILSKRILKVVPIKVS